MAEVLIVNPRKKRKRIKIKSKKNPGEEVLVLANPKRKRKAKRNPGLKTKGIVNLLFAFGGGLATEIIEKGLRLIKDKEGKSIIPAPIRTAAGPILSFIISPYLFKDKSEYITSGAIGAATVKIAEEIERKVLPQDIKQKLGLEEELGSFLLAKEDLPKELGEISEEDWDYVKKAIPYLLMHKKFYKPYDAIRTLPRGEVKIGEAQRSEAVGSGSILKETSLKGLDEEDLKILENL